MRWCGAGGEVFIAVERRWRLGGMRRRPAAEIMAVGAGVNGGRARRGDVTPQAGGDRCRRHCAEVAAACTASTVVVAVSARTG